MARLKVGLGVTLNLGDYQSARFDYQIEEEVPENTSTETYHEYLTYLVQEGVIAQVESFKAQRKAFDAAG